MFEFLSQKFSGVLSWLKDKGRLTEETVAQALTQVKEALLDADVPHTLVDEFLSQIKQEVLGKKIESTLNPGQQFIKIVHEKLLFFLQGHGPIAVQSFKIPSVIMVLGLQGSGKTTTVAKMAAYVIREAQKRNKTRRILVGSVDFYRPAAREQLEILSKAAGVDYYKGVSTEPIAAALELYNHFKKGGYEHLFIDTAGRLHVDNDLMEELRIIDRKITPHYKFLVLDAMTGQESLRVAQAFDQGIGFDQAILTKMDSDGRGGAAFSFKYSLKKPIAFVGCGEKINDLEAFIPERMATRILGMGDILTLIEKAEENIDSQTQEEMSRKLLTGAFTLADFGKQLDMITSMGSLQGIAKYMPGIPQFSPDTLLAGQKEIKIFKAIISSMTSKEALYPALLDASRKRRIAQGSGTGVADVNKLLERFEQSKQFAKMFKKSGLLKNLFKQRF